MQKGATVLDNYRVAVLWGARKETRDEAMQRAQRCLKMLGKVDHAMTGWSIKGPGKEPYPLTTAALTRITRPGMELDATTPRRGVTCRLGFRLEIHAGTGREDWIDHSTCCGVYSDVVFNNALLFVPGPETVSGQRLFRPGILERTLATLAVCYEPSWGTVEPPHDFGVGFSGTRIEFPSVAWMTYLSSARGPLPTLPDKYRVIPVPNRGSIVITVEEPFTSQNPRHLALAQELYELLSASGLMGPA